MSTKSICRVLPVPKSAAAVLRYCYRQRKGDTPRDKAGVLAVAGHAEGGVLVRDARLDSEVLKSRCPLGKNPVKHVVISPEEDGPDVVKRLMRAGQHWCQRFAPGRSFVLIVHKPDKDSPHTHLHIIVESYDAEKALHWSREDAVAMSGMRFTDAFVAVRQDGSPSPSRGASKVYPHARNLQAQKVADLLQAGETWASLKAKKVIKDAPPRRGREDVTSFIYQGKQIRFVTVEKLVGSKVEAKVVAPVPVVTLAPVVPVQQPVAKTKPKDKSKEDLTREAAYAAVDMTRRGLGGLVEKAEEATDEKAIDDLYKGKEPDEPKERGGRAH